MAAASVKLTVYPIVYDPALAMEETVKGRVRLFEAPGGRLPRSATEPTLWSVNGEATESESTTPYAVELPWFWTDTSVLKEVPGLMIEVDMTALPITTFGG